MSLLPWVLAAEVSTAGTLAMLVDKGEAPEVQQRWREALTDPRAEVRAASARLVHAGGAAALVGDLEAAFKVETDAATAAEQIRMLVASEVVLPDSELIAAAARMPAVARIAARVLGRKGGVDALVHLKVLRAFDPSGEARRVLVAAATNAGQEGMGRAASIALREEDAVAWEAVLALARGPRALDEALLIGSLNAQDAAIRAATYWYLAEQPLPQGALLAALEATPEAGPRAGAGDDAVEARFGFELLRRARGFAPKDAPDWIAKIEAGPTPPRLPGPVSAIEAHLTAPERQALFKKDGLPIGNEAPRRREESTLDDPPAVRSNVGYYPSGFAASVVAAAGCAPAAEAQVLVEVATASRPRRTRVAWSKASPECAQAARVLAATAFSAMPPATHGHDLRLMVLTDAFVSWLDQAGHELAFAERGSRIATPAKVKDRPAPKQTKQQRKAGPAKVEALIGRDGQVWALHFLGGDRTYAEAALPVAASWTYAATEIEGKATPVLATLDVVGR